MYTMPMRSASDLGLAAIALHPGRGADAGHVGHGGIAGQDHGRADGQDVGEDAAALPLRHMLAR